MPDQEYLTAWNNYLNAWTTVTAVERVRLLREKVDEQCLYSDPSGDRKGLQS